MSRLDDLAAALSRFLSEEWSEAVEIRDPAVASAGARRRNVLFDAVTKSACTPLVATIIPNAAIQVLPMSVEASSLRLAEAAGAPAPHVHAVSDDASILGGPFFLTSRIDGETIPRRVLRLVAENDGLGAKIARQCGEALACIHSVDPKETHPELPGADQPIEAALSGARALLDGLLQPSPAFTLGWNWLERNRPAEPGRPVVMARKAARTMRGSISALGMTPFHLVRGANRPF